MWGPTTAANRVEGPALDFCLVVTQRRHVDDTALVTHGRRRDASGWRSRRRSPGRPVPDGSPVSSDRSRERPWVSVRFGIANCSGFFGDRLAAPREMLDGARPVDVLTGDYLAELTMLILWKARQRDPAAGYARTFLTPDGGRAGHCLDRG